MLFLAGLGLAGESRILVVSDSVVSVATFHIFPGTDTLRLNGRLLRRGADYTIAETPPVLKLHHYIAGLADTLEIRYTKWPSWLTKSWGRPIDEPLLTSRPLPTPSAMKSQTPAALDNSSLRIAGAKSFRVTSGPGVGSAFGQSLDLAISGELSPGVQLSGAISDKGYDPINGVANSRLEEFDRLHLRLTSAHFTGQAGDISIRNLSPQLRSRDVSGGSAHVSFPTFSIFGVAARPRGRFQSIRLNASDGFQGPYQPTGSIAAIVPGSEQVWLDGRLLKRGADKDYSIDYPTGRITFGVSHPIDARSRIEIDFEPATTQYRQELFVGGAGVSSRDSSRTLAVNFSREGDDKDRSLSALSPDDQLALSGAGDSVVARSGVSPDTLGAYRLLSESLPDTVWRYVGPGNGSYSVRFSFVGAGQGDYRYVGNDQYTFVGMSQGDYAPVILIRPARRTEAIQALGRISPVSGGRVDADIRFSRTNYNLWNANLSSVNGSYHTLAIIQKWKWHDENNSLRVSRQYVDAAYSSGTRFDEPDLSRLFLVPVSLQISGHRTRHDAEVELSPVTSVVMHPLYSQLKYGSQFSSTLYGSDLKFRPAERLSLGGGWRAIAADYNPVTSRSTGSGRSLIANASYDPGRYSVAAEIEYDRRTNDYKDTAVGTRYLRTLITVRKGRNSLSYEVYREDSLISNWQRSLNRQRFSATVEQTMGKWRADGTVTHQWLDLITRQERNLLGRVHVGFDDPSRRFAFSSGYTLSDERRNARGYTYLQVDPGRGNYRLENGRYIADQFGDFLRIEELLSDIQRVRKGERTFRFFKESPGLVIRGSSQIGEELLVDSKRPWWWIVPFAARESAPYLFYDRQYELETKMISWRGTYVVSLSATDSRESRLIVGQNRVRRDFRVRVVLREPARRWILEQGGESFSAVRDQFYGDAGRSDGWRAFVGSKRTFDGGEFSIETGYRHAKGSSGISGSNEKSELTMFKSSVRVAVVKRGEMRLDSELYGQSLRGVVGAPSTVLTDNHEGKQGMIWTLSVNYGLSRTLRLNMAINGRYSDNRPGRLFARSEMTAEF
jgi:hypothetical protein